MGSKVARMMLPDFGGAHLQDVLLLEYQFDSSQDPVLLVSVKSEGSMIQWEAKLFE